MFEAQLIPDSFEVAEECDLRVQVTSDDEMETGTTLEWQFPNAWTAKECQSFTKQYQWQDESADDFISVSAPGTNCRFDIHIEELEMDAHTGDTRHGRRIVARLEEGTVQPGQLVVLQWLNTTAAWIAETDEIYVAVNGEALDDPPTVTSTPKDAVAVRVIAPSAVKPGEAFEVRIVSLDVFDNCSKTRYSGEPVRGPDGDALTEPLAFFSSCTATVTLHEEGVQRLSWDGTLSNPVRVTDNPTGPYWGDVHIHTKYSTDAMGCQFYEYARDVSGLDFAAAADHGESVRHSWEAMKQINEEFNDPGSFVTILAYENGLPYPSGHHNNMYRGSDGVVYHRKDIDRHMKNLWPELDPDDVITPAHHPGCSFRCPDNKGPAVVWEEEEAEFCMVAEIYSHHGLGEAYDPHHGLAYEISRAHDPGDRVCGSVPGKHYLQDAWAMGRRIGIYGSSDDHNGQGGRRHQGVAAVFSDELSREAIFSSFKNRQCYATTGERILLDFSVNGIEMGQEGTAAAGETLSIEMEAYGTDAFTQVELLKLDLESGEYSIILDERPCEMDWTGTVEEAFESDVMYYFRATQVGLIKDRPIMAWSSPVWVVAE
ncbi:MAG: DUF3604 domain-containing protein [Armatimonadota bacterium]